MSKINEKLRNDLLLRFHQCQNCGRREGLEIHHVIPTVKGGENDEKNLIVLCDVCHSELHNTNRSELTKIGIQKARKKTGYYEKYISLFQLYGEIENRLNEDQYIDTNCILDIVKSLPYKMVWNGD